jgi:hypothetical protein
MDDLERRALGLMLTADLPADLIVEFLGIEVPIRVIMPEMYSYVRIFIIRRCEDANPVSFE